MSKRTTTDPLVRLFLDRYHLHLLAIPRENSAVGDLYVAEKSQVFAPGNVNGLIEPALDMPPITTGEHMADLGGTLSDSISADFGLNLLGSFLSVFGAAQLLDKVKATYQSKKVRTLKFRFAHATRDSVDAIELGSRLLSRRLSPDHPFVAKGRQYYLVTGVARTPSISLVAQVDGSAGPDLEAGLATLADAHAAVNVQASGTSELTFSGDRPLAFGVELFELVYNEKRQQLKLKMPEGAIKVRAGERSAEPLVKPAFIGGDDADIFLHIDEEVANEPFEPRKPEVRRSRAHV